MTASFVVLQVLEDLQAIWDWILVEKLHIPHSERNMYSALIVVPETFDNRGNYVFILYGQAYLLIRVPLIE